MVEGIRASLEIESQILDGAFGGGYCVLAGDLYHKTLYGRYCYRILISSSICNCHPSLIFAGKARSIPLPWSPINWVGSSFAQKY